MIPLFDKFNRLYPNAGEIYESFCPYRVCPIGAHSDHQYGLVTGLAINKGIHIIYSPSNDGVVRVSSENLPGSYAFNLKKPGGKKHDWADYLRGAAVALDNSHDITRGIDAHICGTLPIGGLSSSAALTIAFLNALCRVNGITLTPKEMISHALWAENHYVGVKCGKLDQSCELLSKKDHLLYLDTKDESYRTIPKNEKMPPFTIAVIFSGLERNLVGSNFNVRVDEMKSAAFALKEYSDRVDTTFEESRLRDVPYEIFEQYKHRLPENWRKRAEHFYTEFQRVKLGAQAWEEGDIVQFGKLITESGHSSIYNYETGSPELIALHNIMKETDGIYGGRFSGAGFNGCCMALADPAYKEAIEENITKKYLHLFPHLEEKFKIFFCESSDGCTL